ncbi:MAG: sensor histidine kinase [Lachnospiraceae bacterium]|nr:sensor histidine kinase [Lachnospiraceae bacterium]
MILTTDIFLMTLRGALWLEIYFTVTAVTCFVLCMYSDYRKLKSIFDEITEKIEKLDKKYLIPELLEGYSSQEYEIIHRILKEAEVSMSDNVASYRRGSEEYRDYIETWVHEVKIPISASKMIIENHKDVPLEETGISEEIDRIDGYVEQALFYARSSHVEKDFFVREADLRKIVKAVIMKRRKALFAISAEIDIGDLKSDDRIYTDAKWMEFIVGQVIDNSIKYASDERVLKLSFFITKENDRSVMNIRDNGIGMKSSEVSRAFEKGFTGTNGRAGKASTGIGLYLCRKLCLRLGHEITLESAENEGTTVKIIF